MRIIILSIIIAFVLSSQFIKAQTPELVVPTGHAFPIVTMAGSPDGKFILTGSLDGIAILWDRQGNQLTSFKDLSIWKKVGLFANVEADKAPEFGVSALTIFPDGRMLTGGKSGKLIIWKANGEKEKEISEHAKAINAIQLAPDKKHFAAGDDEGNLIYWDTNGRMIWKKKNAHSKVSSLVFSPDGKELFSGGKNRKIEVWNTANGSKLRSFSKIKGLENISSLAISPDGQQLIAGNVSRNRIEKDKTQRSAYILDTKGNIVRELNQHEGSPISVAFTANSGIPIIGTTTGVVIIYPKSGSPKSIQVHEGFVTQLMSDPTVQENEQIISAGADGRATRIIVDQQKIIHEYSGLVSHFEGFGINKNGEMELLWYDNTGQGGFFDLSDRYVKPIENIKDPASHAKFMGNYQGPTELQVRGLTYYGLLGTGSVKRINRIDGTEEKPYPVEEHKQSSLRHLSADGKRAIIAVDFPETDTGLVAGIQSMISLVNMDKGRSTMVSGYYLNYETMKSKPLRGHGKMIISAAFSTDNRKMLTGGRGSTAILWDAQLNKTVLEEHEEGVTAVAFSPDNSIIITGGEDQKLFIRDGNGQVKHSFTDLGFIPNQAVFSIDSRFLFLTGNKSIVHIYDAVAGEKLGRLFLFSGEDWAFLSEDGLFDASSGAMTKMYYVIYSNKRWEKLGLAQLKARFFEPNIMAKLLDLSKERARSTNGLTNVPLFPELTANIDADQLSIQLRSRSGGIGPVSLFINGKEVQQDANPDRKDAFTVDLIPLQKYLRRGNSQENIVTLRAFNKDGWLKSPAYMIPYKPEVWYSSKGTSNTNSEVAPTIERLDSNDPRLFIISIGTSNYTGDQLDLMFADQDARAMAIAFQSVGRQLFNAPGQIEVFCLNTNEEATAPLKQKGIQWEFAEKEKIKSIFSNISQKASAQDIVLVYLSGHGITYGSAEQTRFHYLTQGVSTDDLSDKAIREKYTISDDELTAWINQIPALKQVLVIDACNSGKVVENLTSNSKNLSSSQILALDRMKDRTGMFVISGSASDKVSYESSEFGQGLLTYSLLQGMNGVAVRKTSKGDFIDIMNLFQYARDEVPELAASISGIQTPMLGFPNEGASFDIGIYNQEVNIPIAIEKPVFIRSNFQNDELFNDNLGLTNLLNRKLQQKANEGASANLVFVDLDQRVGAYSIRGRYTVKEGIINVEVRLFFPDESTEILRISPNEDVENIVNQIYIKAKKAIQDQ